MYHSRRDKKIWLPLWIGLAIAIGIFIGSRYAQFGEGRRAATFPKLDAVLHFIQQSYVDEIDIHQFIENTLPRIMEGLDPYSTFFSADEMRRVNEEIFGRFSGVGVNFLLMQDTIVITGILPGGPAEAAGLRQWDRIVAVNDSVVAGVNFSTQDVQRVMRGERGSVVTLGVRRDNSPQIIQVPITRADIPTPTIQAAYMLANRIGMIKLGRNFGHNTFNEFITALAGLKARGANSFVIDLRGNTGGALEIAIAMINQFLGRDQLIVYVEGRDFPRESHFANGSGTSQQSQVVVLVDEWSASASEIFAGAIQDHDRGLVIGQRTHGKGLVQSQRSFPDGSAVRLTVARYYTPSGRSIQRGLGEESIHRYAQHNNTHNDDELAPFQTLGGRTVYGGNGIMPDIVMEHSTEGMNSYFNQLMRHRLVEEYALMYAERNRERLRQFDTWQELYAHLQLQPLLLNLVSFADYRGIRQRPVYIRESATMFEYTMYAHIVRAFFGEEAFWAVHHKIDDWVLRAIELIEAGKTTRDAILRGLYSE